MNGIKNGKEATAQKLNCLSDHPEFDDLPRCLRIIIDVTNIPIDMVYNTYKEHGLEIAYKALKRNPHIVKRFKLDNKEFPDMGC